MRELQRVLLSLAFVLFGLSLSERAEAGGVSVSFHAEERRLRVDDQLFQLPAGDWLARMAEFRAALAEGRESAELAEELGAQLLSAAAEALGGAEQWNVQPLEMAPLSALIAPWSGRPVLEHAAISYGPGSVGSDFSSERKSGVLIVAPFAQENDPIVDSADTLHWEFAAAARQVDFIPRNDAHREGLAALLGERSYGLCWLRGRPEDFVELSSLLPAAAPFLLWTHPMGPSDPELVLPMAHLYLEGGRTLLVDLYRRSESRSAFGVAELLRALQGHETASEALRRARLDLARNGGTREWAGWICVGDGNAQLAIQKPGWLQRLLRRRASSRGE